MVSRVLTYDAFACSRCGACCRKQKAVLLTLQDIFRISRHLGLKPGDFFRKYCTRSAKFNSDGVKRFYLKADGGCPFLRDNACSIQDVKPIACAMNPFYYIESSLAAYKVLGLVEDECALNKFSFDTMTKGDGERLVDMDILARLTDEYIARYGGFDEATAADHDVRSLKALGDEALRAATLGKLVEQAVSREQACRSDPYFKGATGMYLSGFYDAFKKESGTFLVFEPSGLGIIDGTMTLVFPEKDYREIKTALSRRQGSAVHTKVLAFEGREYVDLTIDGDGKAVRFYYHADQDEKKSLRHAPGEILMGLKSVKGSSFTFCGLDADGWLA